MREEEAADRSDEGKGMRREVFFFKGERGASREKKKMGKKAHYSVSLKLIEESEDGKEKSRSGTLVNRVLCF